MREIRNHNDNITFRNENENRHVSGYAVVFNSESKDLGGFYEVIDKRALDGVIEKSDVLCVLNHNQERGLLARSRYGVGTLSLTIDERGLKYDFEAPNTALGDELVEGLKRGDISTSSFAFTVEEDTWEKRSDGSILRTINSINRLFDVSPVFCEAYPETSVDLRSYNNFMEELKKQEIENRSEEEEKEVKETEKQPENDTPKEEEKEEKSAEEETEKETSEEEEDKENKTDEESEENKEEKSCDKEDEKRSSEIKIEDNNLYNKEEINKRNHKFMEKKSFSIIGAVNDCLNRRSNEFVNGNTISIPLEMRADGDGAETPVVPNGILAGVETQGKEVVPNQLWDLMTDLKDKMVLHELGAQFITANGTIEIPRYSGEQCAWVGETEHAVDVAGKFSSIKVSPMRLSAYCDISNTWLTLNSANAEAVLRNEITQCIAEKLQKTILSNGKGVDGVEPQGLMYGVTADTADFTYADAVAMEEQLELANVYSDIKYCVNPSAKSKLRVQPIDKGSGKFVYESNEILGIPTLSTNSMTNKSIILGDWSQLTIVMFGNLSIVVDNISRAVYNQTRIVVGLDCSYAVKRPEAFIKRILK